MVSVTDTSEYYLGDFHKSFFPLDTNRIIIAKSHQKLKNYIDDCILNDGEDAHHFLPQVRCHAAKHGLHLRRTLKLDPVSEFYIYDLINRYRASFRKDFKANRISYGHSFEKGKPIQLSIAYRSFKKAISEANTYFNYGLKLDIATYFNSLYHHDIVKWFDNGNREQKDVEGLGQFLREINSGRSVDCLPHGIHPCKVIGAEFLKFIDNSVVLKSDLTVRFMDDIYLFSNSQQIIDHDFITIQQMAGEKGLNFNNSKTKQGKVALDDIDNQIEEVRKQLLQVRTIYVETYAGEEEVEIEKELNLNDEQIEYLYSLLHKPDLEEMDAELILIFMSQKGEDVLEYLQTFLVRFPNLCKKIFYFCANIEDKTSLAKVIINHIDNSEIVTEEQLFWFAKIAEEYLVDTIEYSTILIKLLEHRFATDISKSKVLEIPDLRFGLPDIKEQYLRNGDANWLSWSSAVGTRKMTKNNRNHILKYFSNVSQMNFLIAGTVREL
ncbi:MAG: reverse transcriptase domain-containing protein [Desulfotalea sp.]